MPSRSERKREEWVLPSDDECRRRHVVCLLDLQGQKDELKKWRIAAVEGGPTTELMTSVRNTAGVVRVFAEEFRNNFKRLSPPAVSEQLTAVSPHERVGGCNVSVQQFGDTCVFYSLAANSSVDTAMYALYSMLVVCSTTMIEWPTIVSPPIKGTPWRGAITLGYGVELEEGNFYGPALAEAYRLESEVAKYPRVVVSDAIMDLLAENQVYSPEEKKQAHMCEMATACRSLLAQDNDGIWIVDYLGEGVHAMYVRYMEHEDCAARAYSFAESEVKKFAEKGDVKLVGRYETLRRYIESRLPIWGIDSVERDTRAE